ncbi:MAG: flavodoxin family protein [Anaerovoracaceae bacterium]
MKYSIVYSSKTGNTAKLAEVAKKTLPDGDCAYYGTPDGFADETDCIFVGFWTEKGKCDEVMTGFLKGLQNKQLFIFGTTGFGGDKEYQDMILAEVKTNLDSSNTVVGSYVCQGEMPEMIGQRYESMLKENPEDEKIKMFFEKYKAGIGHPDATDLDGFVKVLQSAHK